MKMKYLSFALGAEMRHLCGLEDPLVTDADRLLQACFEGDTQTALRVLETEPGVANARCGGVDSPAIMVAAHRGHAGIVRALIAAGADVNAREGASDTTALHWAAEAGHPVVAAMLIDNGAQIELTDSWYSLAPLGWAAHFHHDALAGILPRTE